MSLGELCRQAPPLWQGKYADAFSVRDENGKEKTVFRYCLPFPEERDAILQAKYGMTAESRLRYYQTLVQGIQRNIAVTNLLKSHNVSSVLTCEAVEQENDPEYGRNYIYIQTEAIKPILQVLFNEEINIITLLDVFIRLSIIVRDIAGDPAAVTHRGISMDEIYLNAEGKILLGGFYYAVSPAHQQMIPYLPDRPGHLPVELLQDGHGGVGTDMQTISLLLYNILSGLPWDTQWPDVPRIVPAYAPEGLADILDFGMHCTDAECNRFRRRLLDYRKELCKSPLATGTIPLYEPFRKEYVYE